MLLSDFGFTRYNCVSTLSSMASWQRAKHSICVIHRGCQLLPGGLTGREGRIRSFSCPWLLLPTSGRWHLSVWGEEPLVLTVGGRVREGTPEQGAACAAARGLGSPADGLPNGFVCSLPATRAMPQWGARSATGPVKASSNASQLPMQLCVRDGD